MADKLFTITFTTFDECAYFHDLLFNYALKNMEAEREELIDDDLPDLDYDIALVKRVIASLEKQMSGKND